MNVRDDSAGLLLGEWACLAVLHGGPAHGFAVAGELAPSAPLGRIWSVSRPLTYRSLDQLAARGLVEPVGHEPGDGGPNRTVLRITRGGRRRLRTWLGAPVVHLRDLRSELLLKIAIGERCGIDVRAMLEAQRDRVERQSDELAADLATADDVVARWRHEAAQAALRFLATELARR